MGIPWPVHRARSGNRSSPGILGRGLSPMLCSVINDDHGAALLDVRGITKAFAGVQALKGVDISVRAGEVHCVLGQNGAGKSTLIKVLSGVHHPDAGEILWNGSPV